MRKILIGALALSTCLRLFLSPDWLTIATAIMVTIALGLEFIDV